MQAVLDKLKLKLDAPFAKIAKLLMKFKVTPNQISLISLLFGIIAIYFLFEDNTLFIVFILLHLILDKLDGVLARVSKKVTKVGEWLDYLGDSTVAILLIVKSYFYLNEVFALLALSLFLIHHGIFLIKKDRKTLIGSRTVLCLFYIFGIYTLALIISAFGSSIGIVRQLWSMKKK